MVQQGGAFGKRKEAPVSAVEAAEQRRTTRRPTFQNGKIHLETGAELTCAICNIGEDGCEISMRGVKTLPEEIKISIGMTQEPRKAQIIWRDQNTAGLQFMPDDAAEDGSSDNSVD